MKKIAIVEDEEFMREELAAIFQKEGYEVVCVTEFAQAAEHLLEEMLQLVLLDLNLPGLSGFEICRRIRRRSTIPVLILTSRDQMKDEVQALSLGADEYLTKPCHKEWLLARVSSLLRRTEGQGSCVKMSGLRLDRSTYTLYAGERTLMLPENQGKLLELLLLAEGKLVTREQIEEKLWGTTEYVDEGAVHVNMTRLKKTLSGIGLAGAIEIVRGQGYRCVL